MYRTLGVLPSVVAWNHMKLSRRDFLAASGAGVVSVYAGQLGAEASAAGSIRVVIVPDQGRGTIAPDFMGLGYEISSVAQLGLLSASNQRMLQFIRTLGANGVIRVGGITSDYAHWLADGHLVSAPKASVVTQAVMDDLGRFLRAMGWELIWGLNLGSATADEARDEAQAVSAGAGSSLLAFEVGNEPDLFVPAHRKRGWGCAEFIEEYRRYKKAIRERLPDAPFAGPDTAGSTDWVQNFARAEGGDLKLLTHHYYAGGPPQNPAMTIENLLANGRIDGLLKRLQTISSAARLPYRLCELNSCFGGGKPGISDTFASALWILDLLFNMAAHDCSGVNVETGVNQLGFVSSYSPIYPDGEGGFVARPIYYGMLAFAHASNGKMLSLNYNPGSINLKAYAVLNHANRILVTLINKDLSTGADVRVELPGRILAAIASRLTAPSITSKEAVKFAEKTVNAEGEWQPGPRDQIQPDTNGFEIHVPSVSAAVVEVQTD